MGVAPLVITGMHRSGTSALARLLGRAGIDLGDRLMTPQLDNPVGYYEDLEFCDLNLALLAAGVGDDPRHQPDWAFPEQIVPARLEPFREQASALLTRRGEGARAWGFKDPRTSVLLDFYDSLVPDARYVFVYRAPWDVLASLMRVQQRPLAGRAAVAVRAWMTYNDRLLEFRARHPARVVLVEADALHDRPRDLIALVQAQVDALAPVTLDAAAGADAFVPGLLGHHDTASPLAELLAADHPEALALYGRLEAAADLPGARAAMPGAAAPRVDVEGPGGPIDLGVVVVGDESGDLHGVSHVARPGPGSTPAAAADAGLAPLPTDLVAVLFGGPLRRGALATAVAAIGADPQLGAVLLAGGDELRPPHELDPLICRDVGAGVVLRRSAWLASGGFAAAAAPPGHEAWAFAVACTANGLSVARLPGALGVPGTDEPVTDQQRDAALARHPRLAQRRLHDALTAAQLDVESLEAQLRDARGWAQQAEADRARLEQDLATLRVQFDGLQREAEQGSPPRARRLIARRRPPGEHRP